MGSDGGIQSPGLSCESSGCGVCGVKVLSQCSYLFEPVTSSAGGNNQLTVSPGSPPSKERGGRRNGWASAECPSVRTEAFGEGK